MKRLNLIILVIVIAFSFQLVSGQIVGADKTPMKIGVKGGGNLTFGEGSSNPLAPIGHSGGVYFGYPLSTNFLLNFSVDYEKLEFDQNNVTNQMFSPGIYGEYYIPTTAFFRPYLDIGAKLGIYSQDDFSNYEYAAIPSLGLGFDIPVSDKISLALSTRFNYTTKDDFDEITGGRYDDSFVDATLGISYHLGSINKTKLYAESAVQDRVAKVEKKVEKERSEKERLEQTIQQQKGKVSDLKKSNRKLKAEKRNCNEKVDSLNKLVQQKDMVIDSLKKESKRKSETTTTKAVKSTDDINDIYPYYKKTVSIMYQKGDFQKAIARFDKLSNKYPDHTLTGNFIYMKGESYYHLGDYQKALEQFQEVENYPRCYKLDDAMYMRGLTNYELGNEQVAKSNFQNLLDNYSDSEYVADAKKRMDKIE